MEILNVVTAILAVVLALYWYLKNVLHTYWKRKGIPYVEPEFYYGNIRRIVTAEISLGERFLQLYKEVKSKGQGHGGVYMFFTPMYLPTDPELIKSILHKDFSHFVNHGVYFNEEADPLSGQLFNLEDAKWRNLRAKLSPTFTSGKMKMMFETLVACSDGLEQVLNEYSTNQEALDVKELLARFTTDVIGSCAFGLDCNSLKNPDSEFRRYGKKIFEPTFEVRARFFATRLFPSYFLTKIGFRVTPRDIEDFFMGAVKNTVDYREKNNIVRKDFLHLMLQLKNGGKITDEESINDSELPNKSETALSMNELAAQCFIFFGAGFEPSSTVMSFALYELAVNQNIQAILREEIRHVIKRHDNKLTYDSIMEMTYLDKVLNETFRLHPPAPSVRRICNKDYPVPGKKFILERGTVVHIPIYGLHTDPEFYPKPEVFDPERFSEENKAKRPPQTFMPFGDGPRICIGLRFGMLQAKVGLVRLLKDYNVTLNEKTIYPMEIEPKTIILSVKGGVWLNIKKASNSD